MTSLGTVWNKALGKSINVLLAESGSGFKRLTGAIDPSVESAALAKVKHRFEAGALFNDADMQKMEQLVITDMSHTSEGDPNAHYSVDGKDSFGTKIKGGHAQEDDSKQTQAS